MAIVNSTTISFVLAYLNGGNAKDKDYNSLRLSLEAIKDFAEGKKIEEKDTKADFV